MIISPASKVVKLAEFKRAGGDIAVSFFSSLDSSAGIVYRIHLWHCLSRRCARQYRAIRNVGDIVCIRISANNSRVCLFAVRGLRLCEKQKLPRLFAQLDFFLVRLSSYTVNTQMHGEEAHERRPFARDFTTIPLSSSRPPLVRVFPFARIIYFFLDAYRRRSYFSMRRFDIDTLYPREYIIGLPSNTHTNALRPTAGRRPPRPLTLDGYIHNCDLRYCKLLSKARPKTRDGCIKFLNSSMTATGRRCLSSLLQTRGCTKALPSSDLSRKQVISAKSSKVDFPP